PPGSLRRRLRRGATPGGGASREAVRRDRAAGADGQGHALRSLRRRMVHARDSRATPRCRPAAVFRSLRRVGVANAVLGISRWRMEVSVPPSPLAPILLKTDHIYETLRTPAAACCPPWGRPLPNDLPSSGGLPAMSVSRRLAFVCLGMVALAWNGVAA